MKKRILLSALIAAGLAMTPLAPAAFADDMKKDTMSKDSMSKDSMKKDDNMSKDGMAKDTMAAKPMVLYESDDFICLASEEVAIRTLLPREIDTSDPYDEEVRVWQR